MNSIETEELLDEIRMERADLASKIESSNFLGAKKLNRECKNGGVNFLNKWCKCKAYTSGEYCEIIECLNGGVPDTPDSKTGIQYCK